MSLLHRTMDPAFLNEVVNHPEVRVWLGGEGPLDLAPLIQNPANFAIVGEFGGWLLIFHEPGVYECHTQVLPEGRGGWSFSAAEEGLRWMFTATDAMEIVTKVPAVNKPALNFTRQLGFQEVFRRTGAWDAENSEVVYFSLTFDRWRGRDKVIAGEGHAFHLQIEAAKVEAGSPLPAHDDDEAHDRAVGAAMLMVRAGNPVKAVRSYNRWARLAGYVPIELVGVAPTIIDVRDALVTERDGAMEVLLCR